jgi:hypothetical protein
MTEEEAIDSLSQHEAFARLLNSIHQDREMAISGLYDQTGDDLLRTSGEIKALDMLLVRLNYDKVLEKWSKLMQA